MTLFRSLLTISGASKRMRTFDTTQTAVVDPGIAHVVGWYDNEWGFGCRMLDTAALFGSL